MVDTSSTGRRAGYRDCSATSAACRPTTTPSGGRWPSAPPTCAASTGWSTARRPRETLATATGLRPAATTALIDRLEAKGLVERFRDEADRRRVLVRMTEEGMRSTYAMYAPLVEEGQGLFAHHTVAELTAMRDLLDAMRDLTDRHRDGIAGRRA